MLDSKNINTIISAHVSVSVDEIKKAVVDMTAAGVDPGTADRQMASFRQLFIGFSLLSLFHLTPSHYATTLFYLPPFLSKICYRQHFPRTNSIMTFKISFFRYCRF